MSHYISLSESDDSDQEHHKRGECRVSSRENLVSKYKCPDDFVSFKYNPSASALLDDEQHKELWLIKAPSSFDPKIFTDLKVSLSSLKTIHATRGTSQSYSVLGSRAAPADVHLLTSTYKNQSVSLSAASFTGTINISESYGNSTEIQCPLPVPAAPAPCVTTDAVGASTSASPLKRAKLEHEECDEQRKKKKKKKTEKHDKKENVEAMNIKEEQTSCDCDAMQVLEVPEAVEEDGTMEKKKKKKKKKHKETEDCPDEVAVDAKQEPIDTSYGDIDSSVKKKKKKKKKETDE